MGWVIKMCELQFIKSLKQNLTDRDLEEFFKLMEFGSLNNKNAFGFFNHNHTFKEKGTFNLKRFKHKKLLNEGFIVGHNRFTTSGSEDKNFNNHPFEIDEFVLSHNGVLFNDEELRKEFKIKSKIETDSFVILWLINHYFKKSKKNNRVKKMTDAIKRTTLKISGSYSVFVYDKEDKNLYYFKNSKTDFKFCLLGNSLLIGSTNKENLKHIYLNKKYIFDEDAFKKRVFKDAKDETIYLINDDVIIKEIGVFEELNEYVTEYPQYTTTYPKTQKGVLNYASDVENGEFDVDLDGEIEYILNDLFGYCVNFEILNKDVVKIKDDGAVKEYPYFTNYKTDKKGYIYVKIDEILNLQYRS